MKKVLFIAIVGLVSFTSCKKDYTCSCSANGNSWSQEYSNMKKADAETQCNEYESYSKLADPDATCSIN